MDLNSRLKIIENLDIGLSKNMRELKSVISTLNWSEEMLMEEVRVQCPIDSNHWVPESQLPKHIEKCSWIKEGYPKEDFDKQLPGSGLFYEKAPSVISITLGKEKQMEILRSNGLWNKDIDPSDLSGLPRTNDRLCAELNADQRVAIYDYVVNESKIIKEPPNVALEDLLFDFEKKNDDDGKPKSHLEILAEQRDYKRRRQSYRAKNVHITKKSYTEVMKEVIENQISYLAETRKQEGNDDTKETQAEMYASDYELNSEDNYKSYSSGKRKSKRHHDDRSRSPTPKKRKHKHKRSRSRSRSRHKKSNKHKKYHK